MTSILFNHDQTPEFLDILSPLEKQQYLDLRDMFCTTINDTNIISSFSDVLNVIKQYSIRNNEDDSKRCDCCGICWLSDKIGVNTNRLSYLTGQKKNNINSAFLSLMYLPTTFTDELYKKIPGLESNFKEKRMWTIRKLKVTTPQPEIRSSFSAPQKVKFSSPDPQVIANSIFQKQWSYEDFAYEDPEQRNDQDFFQDPYAIPLNCWYNECQ